MKLSACFALAAFALTAPLHATEKQDGAKAETESSEKTEKKVCKRETSVGSKFATKVCRTAAEWKAVYEQGRDGFEDRDKD